MARYGICLAFAVFLPWLVAADSELPFPTGCDLLGMTYDQFQMYVAGIYEGQLMMASIAKAEPVVCAGPEVTRTDLAALCHAALPVIPDRMMTLPAVQVVLSILMRQHPCEAATTEPRKVSPPA